MISCNLIGNNETEFIVDRRIAKPDFFDANIAENYDFKLYSMCCFDITLIAMPQFLNLSKVTKIVGGIRRGNEKQLDGREN